MGFLFPGVRKSSTHSNLAAFPGPAAPEQWRSPDRFRSTTMMELTMGILEISIVLACASAFGFYLAETHQDS